MKWEEYLRHIVEAERASRPGEPSPVEMMDAAWEDPQGRLPHEPGYGTGGELVELPAREPRRVVVGDVITALRFIGNEARRAR